MDWFCYNLIILNKECKVPYKNLDEALLFLRNQVFSLEILKTLTSSNYPTVQYFWLKLCTRFLLTIVYKSMCGIFFISVISWVICKNLKRHDFCTLVFYTFINDSRPKQNKKNPTHHFVENVCKISAKNINFCGSWSSSKFSISETKNLVYWK